jgi:hypothetical protein
MFHESGLITKELLVAVAMLCAAAGVVVVALSVDFSPPEKSTLGEDYEYDLSDASEIDPALLICVERPQRAIPTGLMVSRAVASGPDGQVCVAGDRSVRIFSAKGEPAGRLEFDDQPRCLAVGAGGVLYVGFRDHVRVMDLAGAERARWANAGEKAMLTSIALLGDEIFVADAGGRAVLRYSAEGELRGKIGLKDKTRGVEGFVVPSPYFDVVAGADGLVRVVNPGRHRVEIYTPDGEPRGWWGGRRSLRIADFCGCCNPSALAITPDGEYVTAEKGLFRVKIYDGDGEMLGVVAGPGSFLPEVVAGAEAQLGAAPTALDLTVTRDGEILILDPRAAEVRVFERVRERADASSS